MNQLFKRLSLILFTMLTVFVIQSCQDESLEIDKNVELRSERSAANDEGFPDSESTSSNKVQYEILIQFDHNNQLNSSRNVYVKDMQTGDITTTNPRSTAFYTDGQENKFNWSGDINESTGHSYYFDLGTEDPGGQFLVYTLDKLSNSSFKNALLLTFHSTSAPDVRITYKHTSTGFEFSGGNNPESLSVSYRHDLPTPSLLTPAINTTLTTSSATFSWKTIPGVVNYTLNVDGNTYTTSGTSYTVNGLSNGNHTWKVKANFSGMSSNYSWARNFNVNTSTSPLTVAISGPPSINLPTKDNPGQLTYYWDGIATGGSGNKVYRWYENNVLKHTGIRYYKPFSYTNNSYYFTIELRVTDDTGTENKYKTIHAVAGGGGEPEF